jgi:predicted aspartyl protease
MSSCLTAAADGIARAIVTPCGFSAPHLAQPPPEKIQVENFLGIWDTGASGTVITQQVVEKLGLIPISMTEVLHADGKSIAEVYLVAVYLPNNVGYAAVKVTKGKLPDGINALIGMDIICSGDFSITNLNGKTVMSFRYPSSVRTDYVEEHTRGHKPVLKQRFSKRRNNKRKR